MDPEQTKPSTNSTYSEILEDLHGRSHWRCKGSYEPFLAFRYIRKNLRLGAKEIKRVRDQVSQIMLRDQKLILILDIDQTLLHSAPIDCLRQDKQRLLSEARDSGSNPRRDLCVLEPLGMIVKLRPFTRTFLEEASTMFDMHLYTMGTRRYAGAIADFLDPDGVYFKHKVISRDDSTDRCKKSLDVVLGDERMIVILDDTCHVWKPEHAENQIASIKYKYFVRSSSKSRSKTSTDEREEDGLLHNILRVLKRAHTMFYSSDHDLISRDVREVLKEMQKKILEGCVLAFDTELRSEYRLVIGGIQWKLEDLAAMLGATFSTEMDSCVTHVISRDKTSSVAQWAVENQKFLVTPYWVRHSFFLWKRLLEDASHADPCMRLM